MTCTGRAPSPGTPSSIPSSCAATTALNPPESLALGRLITEIGVAPSSPLEYLVLRISQDVDGTAAVTPVASPAAAVPASLLTADAMRRAGA